MHLIWNLALKADEDSTLWEPKVMLVTELGSSWRACLRVYRPLVATACCLFGVSAKVPIFWELYSPVIQSGPWYHHPTGKYPSWAWGLPKSLMNPAFLIFRTLTHPTFPLLQLLPTAIFLPSDVSLYCYKSSPHLSISEIVLSGEAWEICSWG